MFPVDTAVKVCGSVSLKDSEYKVVHFTELETFFVEICNRPRKLYKAFNNDVSSDFENKAIYRIKYSLPSQLYLTDSELKEQWVQERDKYKELFSPIIKNIYDFIEGNSAGLAVFKEVAENSGLGKTTIYSKIYKYLMYGQNSNAFLPGHFLKGGAGSFKKTTSETKIRGRPKERKKRHGTVNVGDKEKKWIIDAYKKYYKKQSANGEKCNTLKQVCHALWHDHYLLDPQAQTEDKKYQQNRISEANFYYWIHKLIPDLEIVRRDVGKLAFAKDFNYLHGKSSDLVIAPGQIYFIDATPTDVYLSSEFELIKKVSPGKLTLYITVDAFSGMIVGYHISFGAPNYAKAQETLFCSFIKKSYYGELIGIDINDDDFPCHHVCAGTCADKAELISEKKDDVNYRFFISSADSCPPYRGDSKGPVESTLKLFNHELFQRLPGAVVKRVLDRGDQDPSEEATISYYDAHKLTLDLIYFINSRLVDRQYFTKEMSKVGVKPTPIDIWKWGLENCHGFAIDSEEFDKKLLYTSLSERVQASINDEGIHVLGTDNRLCYLPAHQDLQKLARVYKKSAKGTNLSKHYTAHRILGVTDFLYLIPKNVNPKDGSKIIECKLSTRSERFYNMTIDEAYLLIEKEKDQDDEYKERHHNKREALIENRRATVKAAFEVREAGKKAAKNRKKDKRSHQDIERELLNREKARQAQKVLNGIIGDGRKADDQEEIDGNYSAPSKG